MRVFPLLKTRPAAFTAMACILAAIGLICWDVAERLNSAFANQSERIEQSRARLAVYRAQAKMQPVLATRLTEFQTLIQTLPGLMKSEKASAASAQLQADLRQIVQKNRGEIHNIENLTPAETNGFEQIAVRSAMVIPMMALRDVIYDIEAHTPYYFIDRITITATADTKAATEPRLQIDWTVYGLRRSSS